MFIIEINGPVKGFLPATSLLFPGSISSKYNLLLLRCFPFIVENEGRLETGAVYSLRFCFLRGRLGEGVFAHLVELVCDADMTKASVPYLY